MIAEVKAEIKMLRKVLCAAGISCDAGEQMTDTEYRTFLISQLKPIPWIIEDLRRQNEMLEKEIAKLK
ncbi:MAG: hypothetical protein ABFC34_16960 [Methanobacterium sp.]